MHSAGAIEGPVWIAQWGVSREPMVPGGLRGPWTWFGEAVAEPT